MLLVQTWVLAVLLASARGCLYNNLTATTFSNNNSLSDLDLSGCQIAHIPQNLFKHIPKLTNLDLRRNVIAELTNSSFEGLKILDTLDLSENKLTSLPDDFLNFLPLLEELYLNDNPLREISSNIFRVSKLIRLDINNNMGSLTLAPRALADMTSLSIIKLNNCSITAITGDVLHGSDALTEIDLSNNHIENLPADVFVNKTNLEFLYVNNNNLRVLSPAVFASLDNLMWLELDNNEITEIAGGTFSSLNNLMFLSMKENRLCKIAADAFPVSLVILLMDHNELTSLETNGLPALKTLHLSNNSFSSVPQRWPETLPALEIVYLSNNTFTKLTKTDMAVLSHYPAAAFVFDYNKIVTVLVDQNTTVSSELWLTGAPLRCDCFLHRFAARFSRAVSGAYCAEPAWPGSTALSDVPLTNFVCRLESCPNICNCVVKPNDNVLEVVCKEELSAERKSDLDNLRLQHFGDMTNSTVFYIKL